MIFKNSPAQFELLVETPVCREAVHLTLCIFRPSAKRSVSLKQFVVIMKGNADGPYPAMLGTQAMPRGTQQSLNN